MDWLAQTTSLMGWYLTLFVLGLVAYPWLALLFRRLPDRGYGASRVAGLLFLTFTSWWIASAGVRSDATLLYGITALGFLSSGLLLWRNERLRRELRPLIARRLWRIELGILVAFAVATVLRAFQPEIFWGEKPMDFTFFNYFARLETLPPEDPWASDRPMRYYYMGNWMFGVLSKMTGVAPGIGYNLALVAVATLAYAALVSALLPIVRRTGFALAGAALPLVLSNGEALRLLLSGERLAVNFDFFWATSRILKHSIANEYPFWSYLFGDLHAHVMALPGSALVLALFVGLLAQKKRPPAWRGIAMRLAVGAALGATFPVNGWDAIAYAIVLPVTLAWWAPARVFRDAPRTGLGRRGLDLSLVGLGAFAVAYPFWESILPVSGAMAHGWTTDEFHDLASLWRVGAVVWLPLVGLAILRALRGVPGRRRAPMQPWQPIVEPERRWWSAKRWDDWMRWTPLVVLVLFALHPAFRVRPWANLFTATILFGAAWIFRFENRQSGNRRIVGALLAGGGALFLFVESYWLVERLNSLFKLHYALWFLCAFLVAASLPSLTTAVVMAFRERFAVGRNRGRAAILFAGIALILVPAAAATVGTATATLIMTTFERVPGPRPTLDGTAYLPRHSPADAPLIRWLNENAASDSVVLEAHGDAYREFTRIAMHTGLPTVLGWEHHVKQRSTPPDEVDKRKRDIATIYTTRDDAERFRLLDRYGVRYVVVAPIERARYGADALAAWDRLTDTPSNASRIRVAFETSEARVFAVAPPRPPERALTATDGAGR
jgi:YYY domain-containing protein